MDPINALSQVVSFLSGPLVIILTAVVSGLIGFFSQFVVPEDTRVKIIYAGKKTWHWISRKDRTAHSKITRSYEVNDPENTELEDLSDEIWEQFGARPTGRDDHFSFTKTRNNVEFQVDIQLTHNPSSSETGMMAGPGVMGGDAEQRVVQHVRISVESDMPYHQLQHLLMRGYDLLRDVEADMPTSLKGDTYALSCETGQPPTASFLIGELGFLEFTATTENGLQLDCGEEKVKVRNHGESEIDDAIQRTEKLVTLFG